METVATVKLEIRTELMWCGHYVSLPAETWKEAHANNNQNPKLVCPYGHAWIYKENETTKLRAEITTLAADRDRALNRAYTAEKSLDGALGEISRIKRRAKNGICQDCHRSFRNVALHVRLKHGPPAERPAIVAAIKAGA